ncbi:MAG: hypothetical protein IJ635_10295 [Bacteroidaceae bacterium]|nr:hypothetical protein [Bacteroidaceae bacterium]
MVLQKKYIGTFFLLGLPYLAVAQTCPKTEIVKQDSITVKADSVCCNGNKCATDTTRQKTVLLLPTNPFIENNPKAVKVSQFDPYKKKFLDMQLINIIGPHIKR